MEDSKEKGMFNPPICWICGEKRGLVWLRKGFVCGECYETSRVANEEKIVLAYEQLDRKKKMLEYVKEDADKDGDKILP